jgi:hypothetical protein
MQVMKCHSSGKNQSELWFSTANITTDKVIRRGRNRLKLISSVIMMCCSLGKKRTELCYSQH